MRALIQRVSSASVKIDQESQARIGPGLLVFLGVTHSDSLTDAEWMAGKVSRLRIFGDDSGKMNRSLLDTGGEILIVSQFTLYGDASRGNRPGFDQAALPKHAEPLYEAFCQHLAQFGLHVQTGRFAAHMEVSLTNDGPVTIWLESPIRKKNEK
jgi:D-aminoacyl-tRNA deacylase